MSDFPTHIEGDGVPHVISIIRDLRHPAFRSSERAVLWALAARLNPKKGVFTIFSAMETIADDAGLDESAARRIMKWLVSIGVVVEVPGKYRAKSRQIDFARLASLPVDMRRVGGVHVPVGGADVLGEQDSGTPSSTTVTPAHVLPRGAHDAPGGVHVPVGGCPRPPEEQKKNTGRTKEEHRAADVPSRSSGERLAGYFAKPGAVHPMELPFGQAIAPTTAKPKAQNRAGPKRKFTDEQIAARDDVYKFWKKTYFDEFKVEPIVGNAEVGQMVHLLKKLNWNAASACELIANAFTYAFFRERIKTIGHIVANASSFQFPCAAPAKTPSAIQGGVGDKLPW